MGYCCVFTHDCEAIIMALCFNPYPVFIYIFTHLKLCLATAIHNFKWVKITHIFYTSPIGQGLNPFRARAIFIRQILMYKNSPSTKRIKKIIMEVDPKHRYSNKAGRDNQDNFQLRKNIWSSWFIQKEFGVARVNYWKVDILLTLTARDRLWSSDVRLWQLKSIAAL